ncbi:MAG: Lrp/AsnC family transcriptional regulator [Candidatus Woesearchaeota archaeon]|nr:Lrp/AsnC family transcriptional regulator [Candidatus Woesearchaeota archaeon]
MALDKKDFKILEVLKENAKLSTQQISKKTLIPITTVHHRIKKLEKQGIIKGYTVLLDNKKLGKALAAYVLITVDYKSLREIKLTQHDMAKKLKAHEFVEAAAMVTGGTDIIIKIRVKDIDQMDEFVTKYLRNVDGIERTQTMVILSEF